MQAPLSRDPIPAGFRDCGLKVQVFRVWGFLLRGPRRESLVHGVQGCSFVAGGLES